MRRPQLSWLAFIIRRYVPWVVIDLPLVWLCYALGLLVRGVTTELDYVPALVFNLLASALVVVCNEAFGIYRRWWRYATSQDVVPLVISVACATALIVGADLAWPNARPMPLSSVFLGSFFAFCGMTAIRYRSKPIAAAKRTWRRLITPPQPGTTRVLIVGAGEAGQQLAWQLQSVGAADSHQVIGFVDDDGHKQGMLIHGRKVLGDRAAIPRLVESLQIDLIVIAIHNISGRDFRDIVGICQETPTQIKVLPDIVTTIRSDQTQPRASARVVPASGAPGGGAASLFGDITLEDLLGRHSVSIDRAQCQHLVRGKTVLVTGAGGSIGGELCRQLADLRPARLLMLDLNESGLHDLRVELAGYHSDDTALVPIVTDVTNRERIRAVFAAERPALVFHTAAYKHVPLMEEYPDEAVRVNVGGTRLAMELAAEHGTERFVLVSSDKAVEPSSVMGATKRVCELLGAAMPTSSGTRFTAVRFGNVLASRGSVVPTFTKQIDLGGPVTITDPRMFRYFMSLAEASSLVIQAASYTEGGDVFILDMGEELNVAELARRMIRLRGLRPDVDIPIVVTGPRPGEKLREVLTAADERRVETPHPQVFRVEGGSTRLAPAELVEAISDLVAAARTGDREAVRVRLWAIVGGQVLGVGGQGLGAGGRAPGVGIVAFGSSQAQSLGVITATRPVAPKAQPPAPSTQYPTPITQSLVREARAPIRVLTDQVGAALARRGDRLLALEPFYVVPAALLLLAYPNPLVGPALAVVALPWLLRWARVGRLTASTPFDLPLGLFLAGATIGLFATTNLRAAGIRLSGILAGVVLYYLLANHATSPPRLRAALVATMASVLLGTVVLVVLTAPYLPLATVPGPWDGLIAATDGWRQAVLSPDEALERYRFRASGVGGLAIFGLALAIGPVLAGARPSARLAGCALAALFGATVLLSGSRGSLVSVAALGVALLALRSGWFLAALPVVMGGLWALLERGPFELRAPDGLPLAVKLTFWQNAVLMLHDYALTGVGLGLRSARDVYDAYFLQIGPSFSHAHNAFIQAYLEQGLLGCAGLVGITATLLFCGRRAVADARRPLTWGSALAASSAAMVLLFEGLTEVVLLTSFGTVLLLAALGLLVAAARLDESQRVGAHGVRPMAPLTPTQRHWLLRVPVLAAFAVALLVALAFTPLGASLHLNLGAVERARAQLPDGLSREERQQRLDLAEAALRRGIALDSVDPALWRNLAEVAIARGDGAEARALLRRAREQTAPGDSYGLFQLGRLYRAAGFWQDAIRAWQDARAVDALLAWASEHRSRNQWDRNSAILRAAADLRPADRDIIHQYAQTARLSSLGPAGTLGELQRLAGLAPASPWAYVEMARLYDELGRSSEAAAARGEAAMRGAP